MDKYSAASEYRASGEIISLIPPGGHPILQSVFVSVGETFHPQQESFVAAVEDYLRAHGMEPRTIGRNYFSNDQLLKAITECIRECAGVIVIALERTHIEQGSEKRGSPHERPLSAVRIPTVWNQIEAALAYAMQRPLLVLAESGLKCEGLLQPGYDWWVQHLTLEPSSLLSPEFTQTFRTWKAHCAEFAKESFEYSS